MLTTTLHSSRPRYAPPRPAPAPIDLPKVELGSGNWTELAVDAWNSPSWKQAALEYHHARGRAIAEVPSEDLARLRRLMSDEISIERAWNEINRAARERYDEAPEATYNALVYELRTHGVSQLNKPNCQRRLANLSIAQLKKLMVQLKRGPNISDELLTALAAIYDSKVSNEP